MLETVDFAVKKQSQEEYKLQRKALMDRLVVLQQEACARGIGMVVLFEGWDGAGKGSRISDLMYKLDARATTVHVTENLSVEEARGFVGADYGVSGWYPMMQEFWKALGPRGNITFYDRGWYTAATQQLLYSTYGNLSVGHGAGEHLSSKDIAKVINSSRSEKHMDRLHRCLSSAADFEKQLVDDGYLVVKFFVHITKEAQRKRLEAMRKNPDTAWRVSDEKMRSVRYYEAFYRMYDNLVEGSDFAFAPWHLINGEDKRAANLSIAATLVDELEKACRNHDAQQERAAEIKAATAVEAEAREEAEGEVSERERIEKLRAEARIEAEEASSHAPRASRFRILDCPPTLRGVDHTLKLEAEDYREQLKKEQKRLARLQPEMYRKRIPLILMYEGWDAAGKGGSIKRVAQALDARAYTIFPSPAPTPIELRHPHLWRYWTRLPKAGHVGIYDRSWYGRVLVERVEGFASTEQWARAYDEINEFEQDLVRWGAILLKFWVEISPDEQLTRFNERIANPLKQWKITDEDWRNRDKYDQYRAAVEDMFRLTSTPFAPWIILESDNKYYARVKALKVINDTLEARLRESR